jgi:RNA polymerase sigma-70 factor (ECF subfamily)
MDPVLSNPGNRAAPACLRAADVPGEIAFVQAERLKKDGRASLYQPMDEILGAIEVLYHDRYDRFRHALAAILGDYDASRDVVQEAFATAIERRRTYRGDGSLEGWIWRIALRTALKHRRKRREAPWNRDLDGGLTEPERDPELAAAVRLLPRRQRMMIFLHYFADLSYAQIAEACEVSQGTVAATLAQARSSLLSSLAKEGVTP